MNAWGRNLHAAEIHPPPPPTHNYSLCVGIEHELPSPFVHGTCLAQCLVGDSYTWGMVCHLVAGEARPFQRGDYHSTWSDGDQATVPTSRGRKSPPRVVQWNQTPFDRMTLPLWASPKVVPTLLCRLMPLGSIRPSSITRDTGSEKWACAWLINYWDRAREHAQTAKDSKINFNNITGNHKQWCRAAYDGIKILFIQLQQSSRVAVPPFPCTWAVLEQMPSLHPHSVPHSSPLATCSYRELLQDEISRHVMIHSNK